jgi:hypothetical protein
MNTVPLRLLFFALLSCCFPLLLAHAQTPHLQPITTFGPNGDGSLRAGDRAYLTTTGTERGLVYNPVTGHLLLVSRANPLSVYILDAATGADLGTLDLSALTTGGNASFLLNMIGIGEDGAIYAANLSNNNFPPVYNLYRWASETNVQELIFDGNVRDVSNGSTIDVAGYKRFGDTMAVRGAGTNTQVLIASRGTNAVLLMPIDDTLTNWNPVVLRTDAPIGGLGFGLAFSTGNTFYATAGASSAGPLLRLSFNLGDGTNGTATVLQSFSRSIFPGNVSALGVSTANNLLAGLDVVAGPDSVRVYDISIPASLPSLLDRRAVVTDNLNDQFAGALAFGTNGALYVLNANNGLMAYNLVASTAPVAPSVFFNPASQNVAAGSNVTFTATADGTAPLSYQWYFNETNALPSGTNATLIVSNAQPANIGGYTLVVTNVAGTATSAVASLAVFVDTSGVLVAYDGFEYAADQLLTAGSPSWLLNSGTDDTFVTQNSLQVPGLKPSLGNSITNGAAGGGVRLELGTNIAGGAVYYSFAMRVNSVGTAFSSTTSFIAAFINEAANTQEGRLVPRTNTVPGQYNLGVTKVTSSAAVWATNNFVDGETVFIVCRYVFNLGTTSDDAVAMWINPSPATFGAAIAPTPTLTATLTGTDITSIDRFTFRQNTAANTPANIQYDELRIGTSWEKVTPPAPPAAPALAIVPSAATVMLSWPTNNSDGFNLEANSDLSTTNWAAVPNSVIVSGTNNTVSLGTTNAARFFRLHKP